MPDARSRRFRQGRVAVVGSQQFGVGLCGALGVRRIAFDAVELAHGDFPVKLVAHVAPER